MMNDFTPLTRPLQSQVRFDSVAKECPSEGFNYPVFRQLNKKARVYLSQPLNLSASTSYHLFATANSKAWFAAVQSTPSGPVLLFSPLEDLRSAFGVAKDTETIFSPKRALPIRSGNVNIITFACGDKWLLVGLENGSVCVYDTGSLFTTGTDEVQPIRTTQIQSSALRQILPNPGAEPNLSDLVAVVGNGKVQLLSMQLEPQGGWAATDHMSQPVSVAWSPKGKHIAIGLQTGDILTFSLTNKSTPHKHIPPTADAILVSLNWLGPGHTFRTSYAAQGNSPAKQHIITLDTKSSAATYVAPDHPYLVEGRNYQNAYTLTLSKWDEDATSHEDHKSLTVVGDVSSVDLEVLGNIGNSWHRHSQDNPLTLPLDKSTAETILLALEADLTDSSSGAPIMYAYLNDGSLQGWHVEHTKPYMGMITPKTSISTASAAMQESKDADMSGQQSTESSVFGQPVPATSAFGQSNFGQSRSPFEGQQSGGFGQSGFGQPQTTQAFGQSSFGQPSSGSFGGFGQSNQLNNTPSPFGAFGSGSSGGFGSGSTTNAFSNFNSSTANVFGQGNFGAPTSSNAVDPGTVSPSLPPAMTREASMSDSTPGFGGLSLGSATPSDSTAVNSMFGSFSSPPSSTHPESTSAFGGGIVKPASGFGAFSNLNSTSSFSSNKPAMSTSACSPPTQPTTDRQTGFGTSSFGKPAFGQPAFGKPSLGATPASTVSGGFSAFASAPTSFGSAAQPQAKTIAPSTSGGFGAFASASPATFGTALKSTSAPESKPEIGEFGAFASNAPTVLGSVVTPQSASQSAPQPSSGGFGAFASATPSAFGAALGTSSTTGAAFTPTTEVKPRTSVFGTPFAGTSSTTPSPFGTPAKSPFGYAHSPGESPKNAFVPSPPSSPEPSNNLKPSGFGNVATTTPAASPAPSSGGAFANIQVTPSAFKPATGFGAFGTETPKSSPFFKKPDETPPPMSAFAPVSSPSKTPASAAASPAFGSPAVLGAPKSAFALISPSSPAPAKTTATAGGFGAFSGATTGFGAFAGPQKSFSELLKSGGEETKDLVKTAAPVPATPLFKTEEEEEKPKLRTSVFGTPTASPSSPVVVEEEKLKPRTSVFGTPTASPFPAVSVKREEEDKKPVISAFTPIPKDKDQASIDEQGDKIPEAKSGSSGAVSDEPSYGTISGSSAASSFVEVGADGQRSADLEDEEPSDDEHPDDDTQSFLSDNFSEDGSYEEESDDESSPEDELPDEGSPSPVPTAIPLPASRSPSATPQPEVPKIEVSPSPSEEVKPGSPKLIPSRESSTTPPGTPIKEVKPLFGSTPTPSTPTTASASPSPFGIGLGRPSTRPARSSPLANAVVPGEGEEEEGKSRPPARGSVSPKPIFGVLPTEAEGSKKTLPAPEGQPPSSKRPKTPPLLSTIPSVIAPLPTAPSAALPSADSSSTKTSVPAPLPFSFGARPAATSTAPGTLQPPSLFGKAPEIATATLPKPELTRAATAPTASPASSLFGIKPPAPPASTPPATAFGLPSFNLKDSTTPSALPTAMPSLFGAKPPTMPQFPPGQSIFGAGAPSQPPASLFGAPKQTAAPPSQGMFGGPIPGSTQPPISAQKVPAATVQAAPTGKPEDILEEGMQKECLNLFSSMDREFAVLAQVAQNARMKSMEIGVSLGGSRNKADLGDASKWGIPDLPQFAQVLKQYQADLDFLSSEREKDKQSLREVQSNMLKAGTRLEEIARFNKAKDNKEFAKMLRARTLGPEHSETQTQLRKSIRTIRDRVQKLEKHLQDDKKKLSRSQTCKPSFRAPSLDTINRTYRNIEMAIDQQTEQVAQLASRISKLDVSELLGSSLRRDARLPEPSGKPRDITPTVAASTAAALNAERSAQRLKRALLSVRKVPLLNVGAATAPTAPLAFNTPKKPASTGSFAFQTPVTGSLFAEPAIPVALPDWDLPEDNFDPTATPLPQGRRGAGGQRKHPSVPLKRSTGSLTGPAPAAATFDWGPLPNFSSPAQTTSLPRAFIPISPSNSSITKK